MTTTTGRTRRTSPDRPEAAPNGAPDALEHLRAGVRAMLYEHPEEARDHLEAAASPELLNRHDPVAIDAMAYLSSVRFAMADVDGATTAARLAVALGPERFAPNQKSGEMALRLGDPEQAAERFLAALRASEPGSQNAKAAEASLREARRRAAAGIKHQARAPRLLAGLVRMLPRRRPGLAHGSVTAGPQLQG
jgi:tetratricopeptide (TPR) repeat protein